MVHDDDEIFCSLKRVFTYIAISFGLDRSWKKKMKALLTLLDSEFFLVFTPSL